MKTAALIVVMVVASAGCNSSSKSSTKADDPAPVVVTKEVVTADASIAVDATPPGPTASGDFCADVRTILAGATTQFPGWKAAPARVLRPQDNGWATSFLLPGAVECWVVEPYDNSGETIDGNFECDLVAPETKAAAIKTSKAWVEKVTACKLAGFKPDHFDGPLSKIYRWTNPDSGSERHELAIYISVEESVKQDDTRHWVHFKVQRQQR